MKRSVRNAFYVALAAASASLEAPRIVRDPVRVARADLVGAPSAVAQAVTKVAANVTRSHLGFDTNVYPGDKAMSAWKESGEYEWVGYYLAAQCHSDTTWAGKRDRLVGDGWGLAVIYVGQQTWGKSYVPVTTTKKVRVPVKRKGKTVHVTRTMKRTTTIPVATTSAGCSAQYVNERQGSIDAHDAIAKATREGFAPGTVIFLDVEYMASVPQRMRDYYIAWVKTIRADGMFKPGVYAHTRNAATIYDDIGDVPFWIAGSGDFGPGRAPTDVGHTFASAWQGLLDVVREHLRFHVAVNERLRFEFPENAERRNGERHIQLHAQCGCGDDERADRRRVVVDPSRGEHGADALRDDRHVFDWNIELIGEMADELLGVADHATEAFGVTAIAGRAAVTARVPGEEPEVVELDAIDKVLPACRVLVAAVEEHDRAARFDCRLPGAIEELGAVRRTERVLGGGAGVGMQFERNRLIHDSVLEAPI